jgi:hypothetical protein
MGTKHRAYTSVQVPSQRNFLGRGFGMEIDNDNPGQRPQGGQQIIHSAERAIRRPDEYAPDQIHYQNAFDDKVSAPGYARREVERTDDRQVSVHKIDDLTLRPDMISAGYDVDTGIKEFLSGLDCDTYTMSGVLAIGYHNIDIEFIN